MRLMRIFIALALIAWPAAASAAEQITDFSVAIDVLKSGDINVAETIAVTAEGNQIRRGIYRDLPRAYDLDGASIPYDYDVKSVTRDGRKEPYEIERDGNAFRIRIGKANVFIEPGAHVYAIEYAVKNQIRYFDDYDELYWNVTGTYWTFPIARARAVIRLPDGARVIQTAGYTGEQGQAGRAYAYRMENGAHVFETTTRLSWREGLTVALGFEKGAVDPPSAADLRALWWARNASMLTLCGAFALISLFYLFAFNRVGRDPVKGPVFAQYDAPAGYSPAAAHFVYHRHLASHRALIATLLEAAIEKRIRIDVRDKKKTELTWLPDAGMRRGAPDMDDALLRGVFNARTAVTLGGKYDSTFTSAYENFQKELKKKFGATHFKWNTQYLVPGVVVSVIAIIVAGNLSTGWTLWHTAALAALAALSAAFSYFLPAPTEQGQKARTDIEGFRLYLKTAEKLHLDSVKPGSGEPPPMTVARYEKVLPYAVALGVEEPWTKHFESMIPETAQYYRPRWTNMSSSSYGSLAGLNQALVSSISSGVVSALPQSSSSSGSGGGGFSGGGGGGGGGGGW